MDSATPPNGGAQNDSIVGGVRVHIGMKGGFGPVLVEQILLNCRYLSVHPTKTGLKIRVIALFPSHFARVSGFTHLSNIYSQNFYAVTDASESILIAY